MSDQGARAVAAVARLRAALEQTASALARPQLDALLAGETEIELALAGMPILASMTAEERQLVRQEIEKTSGAVIRCRRLGAALGDFVRTSLEAQGRSEYGPRRAAPDAGQAFDARV